MKSVGVRELKNRLSEYLREVQSGEAILVTDPGDVVANRWKKAVRLVAKIHRRMFNQRNDFEHKLSREIVKKYGIIVVEDLKVKSLCRGMLAKSVHDAGWAAFFFKLSYKAESAGRQFLVVVAHGTSQRCPVWSAKPQTAQRSRACLCGVRFSD